MPENVLDLRHAEDRATLSVFLTAQGLTLEPAAMEFAVNNLHDDWRVGIWPVMLNLWSSVSGKLVVPLIAWVETLASIHEMREVAGIQEQIRRLGIASHESLDTALVIKIAIKYHRAGYRVAFEAREPHGAPAAKEREESVSIRAESCARARDSETFRGSGLPHGDMVLAIVCR
jgi:hypothetical protein